MDITEISDRMELEKLVTDYATAVDDKNFKELVSSAFTVVNALHQEISKDSVMGLIFPIEIDGKQQTIWVLHGHLSRESLNGLAKGTPITKGDAIGKMGEEHENGGWPPHVHIQLSLVEPTEPDLQGVVSPEHRDDALKRYPDPRNILGLLY